RRAARLRTHARPAQDKRSHRGRPTARGTGAAADAAGESEGCVRALTPGNRRHPGAGRAKAARVAYELREGNMTQASTWTGMSPELRKVAERAKREPDGQFHSLAHLIDELALYRAYGRQRAGAAVGVDGVTKEDYGQALAGNLQGLHERLKTQR